MPKYGLHRYGRFRYGKYRLSAGGSGGASLGPHIRYRIRTISEDGTPSLYTAMHVKRISIPSTGWVPVRMRADDGEWIRSARETIQANAAQVRIRSLESDGGRSEWVYAERGHLNT